MVNEARLCAYPETFTSDRCPCPVLQYCTAVPRGLTVKHDSPALAPGEHRARAWRQIRLWRGADRASPRRESWARVGRRPPMRSCLAENVASSPRGTSAKPKSTASRTQSSRDFIRGPKQMRICKQRQALRTMLSLLRKQAHILRIRPWHSTAKSTSITLRCRCPGRLHTTTNHLLQQL